ncbi:hypothetical protein pb186bvf_010058 [Paramecium bursaria]
MFLGISLFFSDYNQEWLDQNVCTLTQHRISGKFHDLCQFQPISYVKLKGFVKLIVSQSEMSSKDFPVNQLQLTIDDLQGYHSHIAYSSIYQKIKIFKNLQDIIEIKVQERKKSQQKK